MGMKEAENAFSTTTKLLLGKALSPLDDYGQWLSRHLGRRSVVPSALSGDPVFLREQFRFHGMLPKNRLVSFGDREKASKLKIEGAGEMGVAQLLGKIPEIAYFCPDERIRNNLGNEESMGMEDTVNCYRANDAFNSKNVAYSFYTKYSESVFGSFRAMESRYCINAYNCWRSRGLFECDSVKDCSHLYFCHNCENLHESMFCSNVKNLRYAVGNVVTGKEEFLRVKKILLDYVLGELEGKKKCDLGIFNINK